MGVSHVRKATPRGYPGNRVSHPKLDIAISKERTAGGVPGALAITKFVPMGQVVTTLAGKVQHFYIKVDEST